MGNLWSSLGLQISKLFLYLDSGGQKARLLFIGLDAAGKTTILYQMKLGETVTTIPTIGFNVETLDVGKIELTCWYFKSIYFFFSQNSFELRDVGGEDKIRNLWRHYYAGTDCLIFVVDSADLERMDEAWKLFRKTYEDELVFNKPVLLFMNKSDLRNRMNSVNFIERYRLYDYFEHEKWYIMDSCGTTGEGLLEGFKIVSECLRNGSTPPQDYHCKEFRRVRKFYNHLGWRPEIHDLFPKNYRDIVWGLILISDRLDLPMDSVRIILSFLEVKLQSFREMKRISDLYRKHSKKYENLRIVKNSALPPPPSCDLT